MRGFSQMEHNIKKLLTLRYVQDKTVLQQPKRIFNRNTSISEHKCVIVSVFPTPAIFKVIDDLVSRQE